MTRGIEIDEQQPNGATAPDKAMVVAIEDRHQRLIQVELLPIFDQNLHYKKR